MFSPTPTTPVNIDPGVVALGFPEGRSPRTDRLLADLSHVPDSNPLRREQLIQQIACEAAKRDRV